MSWFKIERSDYGTLFFHFGENAFVHFGHDWHFSGQNWYDFTFIKLIFENDVMTGGYEAEAGLLGFTVRWRWNRPESPGYKEMERRVSEMKAHAEHEGDTLNG